VAVELEAMPGRRDVVIGGNGAQSGPSDASS
jgi:hypothetical protein